MSYERIALEEFSNHFSVTTELSSVALGGKIVSVSDDFFAEAFHLLLVESAPSLKGQFGPKGALYSGWESRRHNPTFDWCIIKLGGAGSIAGFDVDTSHFNGNEAPEVSVDALFSASADPTSDSSEWKEILPRVQLGPNSRHLFKIPPTAGVNYVKLNMYPDGGIARFRVYGTVTAVYPADLSEPFDLAHVFAGGRVTFTSDQHFGMGSNLILPGRGKDMGDGWETKRSRQPGHKDWAIIKLGAPGTLLHAEIDTAHFKGNFPESVELHAINDDADIPERDEQDWTVILPRAKTGPHRQHFFHLENVEGRVYTHVKLTIHPDGGVKRVRITGRRSQDADANTTSQTVESNVVVQGSEGGDNTPPKPNPSSSQTSGPTSILTALPLTAEAFAPFGQVVQAYADHNAVPRGTKITPANFNTASKFHKLTLLAQSYPADGPQATMGISVYRCDPVSQEGAIDGAYPLKALERHPYTNQAFIPFGAGAKSNSENLQKTADRYLVVVAKEGEDGYPDLKTLRAFMASAAQGIVYNTGVWHQPMTVLDKPMDLACVETQIGDSSAADCEIRELDGSVLIKPYKL